MTVKKAIPYYVILTGEIGNAFAWGGSNSLLKTERIMRNPYAFRKGQWKTVVEFASREEAYAVHGDALEIAHGKIQGGIGGQ